LSLKYNLKGIKNALSRDKEILNPIEFFGESEFNL
jgi:hypothetical protein